MVLGFAIIAFLLWIDYKFIKFVWTVRKRSKWLLANPAPAPVHVVRPAKKVTKRPAPKSFVDGPDGLREFFDAEQSVWDEEPFDEDETVIVDVPKRSGIWWPGIAAGIVEHEVRKNR